MRYRSLLLVAMVLLLSVGTVWAEEYFPPPKDGSGVIGGRNSESWRLGLFDSITVGSTSYGTVTEECLTLPLASAVINGTPITTATTPGMEVDDNTPGIVFADSETTPASFTFRVPGNYSSGGYFKAATTQSNDTDQNRIDFQAWVNGHGDAMDSAATDQTPVVRTQAATTLDESTLTVATDFASLAAGDVITADVWRDDTHSSTPDADLELKNFVFCYVPKY